MAKSAAETWDSPEGQTQFCRACHAESVQDPERTEYKHTCVVTWQGYTSHSMFPEKKPPVRMRRVGWMVVYPDGRFNYRAVEPEYTNGTVIPLYAKRKDVTWK